MELLDLPYEMLELIATFLPPVQLARLGETCKSLYSVVNIDSLWQAFCWREFKVNKNTGWNLTFKEIYVKILLPLPIVGLKRVALLPYGGLTYSTWCEGKILVGRLYAGKDSKSPLTLEPQFTVEWNAEKEDFEVSCVQRNSGRAPAKITQGGKYPVLECCELLCCKQHKRNAWYLGQTHPAYSNGFQDFPGVFDSVNIDFCEGFFCPLLPMRPHVKRPNCPVTPGIYKGDYGAHGVEILQVGLDEGQADLMECFKLTGDPNVPAGNISIKVRLDVPMILPAEKQNSIEEIIDAEREFGEERCQRLRQSNNGNPDLRQPFRIPSDCSDRGASVPKTCLARFAGLGRIAGHHFSSPSWCRLHFIKFDDDTFGILWLDLFCFSNFYREKQEFPVSTL